MSIEDKNIPVGLVTEFTVTVTGRPYPLAVPLMPDKRPGVLNPWEHEGPDTFLEDVTETVDRWVTQLVEQIQDDGFKASLVEVLAGLVPASAHIEGILEQSGEDDGPKLEVVT